MLIAPYHRKRGGRKRHENLNPVNACVYTKQMGGKKMDKMCITVEEMAFRLRIDPISAIELALSKGFPSFRVGSEQLLVSIKGLEEWIERQVIEAWLRRQTRASDDEYVYGRVAVSDE
jgi:hypothetical protein